MPTTKMIILACIVVLLAREWYVIALHIPRGTVSEAVWDEFTRYPITLAAFAFLAGHFVWQSRAAWPDIQESADGRLKAKAGEAGAGETEKDSK